MMHVSTKSVVSACLLVVASWGLTSEAHAGYETNKFDLKAQVESGGWVVAWSEDITETDALRGVVAAGISVYSGNPAPFNAWCNQLIDRTISSLQRSAQSRFTSAMKSQMKSLAQDVFKAVLTGKSAREVLRRYGTVDFKGGGIRYSGRNYVSIFGRKQTISNTWGLKLYVAFRIR